MKGRKIYFNFHVLITFPFARIKNDNFKNTFLIDIQNRNEFVAKYITHPWDY